MLILGNVVGTIAVILFVMSYQLKNRRSIIVCNAASRVFYVIQYLMLGAFEGALLDVTAFLVSMLCYLRNTKFIKKHLMLTIILSDIGIIGIGMLTYRNVFSLLPILGVIFETLALWMKNERNIRIVSFVAAPFWLVYNLLSLAYGSAAGNVITIVSLIVAMIRYDILGKKVVQ